MAQQLIHLQLILAVIRLGGIKTFSNAPVVNSISLDGKTVDTDANGNMTFNGNKVLTNANLTFSYDSNTETLTVTY